MSHPSRLRRVACSLALGLLSVLAARAEFIRIAGVGANYGNQAANQLVSSGAITGTITRLTAAQFNALTPAQLRASYDVLLITWATDPSLNADWNTRLLPYLQAGGGVIWEDPNNMSDISAIVSQGYSTIATSGWYLVPTPGLTDGVGSSGFANNHIYIGSYHANLHPFFYYYGYLVGVYGTFGNGRIVVQGPDADYHSSAYHFADQYNLLKNEIRWVAQASSNHAPVASAGPDQTVAAAGPGTTGVTLNGTGSADQDNDSLTYSWTWSGGSASGATPTVSLPLGTTTITLTVNDGKGGTATDTVTITVADLTPPVITAPSTVTEEATGPSGAVVHFTATATDAISGPVTVTATPASGSTFPLGISSVSLSATDTAGNTATKGIAVNVTDTTAPTLTVPASQTLEATGAAGAVATFAATATDAVGVASLTYSQSSGTTFALGSTTVTVTAKDAAGNTATGAFTVTVKDTTAPVITVPAAITAEATSGAGAVVSYTTSATDLVSGSVAVSASKASGSMFALGTTTVTLTATDAAGNTATGSFTVTVVDTTAPAIAPQASLTAEATSAAGAVVTFNPSATDAVSTPTVTTSPASGSTFALGTTTVTITAKDAAGNTSTSTFTVTVQDTTAPALALPASQTLEAASAAGATATFAASATDAVGVTSLTYSTASGSTFPIGTTTVTVTAKDAAGNTTAGTFTITVRDTTAPAITSLSTNAPTLWPPNHKMVAVTVSAAATDLVGVASLKIVGATSNEPDNGLGDGDTAGDIELTGALTLNLRAERAGSGNGRIYTITVEAKDAAGNATTKTVTVTVPKSQSGK